MKRWSSLLSGAGPVLGTWSQFASAEVVDILGASGFEFAIVDTEHGHFGFETAEGLVRACDAAGLAPLVRVPAADAWMITKALDLGAAAVVVPRISSVEEAEHAVRAARYGPDGARGACPCIRAGDHLVRDWRAFAADPEAPGVIALVETREGIDAIAGIARVPGLVALLVGPFDLSVSLGLEGNTGHPRVVEAVEHAARVAQEAAITLVLPLFDPAMQDCRRSMERWITRGVRHFTIGTDKLLFADHCARYVATLRRA